MNESNLIMYKTTYGKANIALYARDGNVWLSQAQVVERFPFPSKISTHIV